MPFSFYTKLCMNDECCTLSILIDDLSFSSILDGQPKLMGLKELLQVITLVLYYPLSHAYVLSRA